MEQDPQKGSATLIIQVQWGVLFTTHKQNISKTPLFHVFHSLSSLRVCLPSTKDPLGLLFYVLKIQSPWNHRKTSLTNKVQLTGYTFAYNVAICYSKPGILFGPSTDPLKGKSL